MEGSGSTTLCCWCCASGPIEASFHVDRKGYVPGEAIRLLGHISNESNQEMESSFVTLKMVIFIGLCFDHSLV